MSDQPKSDTDRASRTVRRLVAAAGIAIGGTLAGCSGTSEDGSDTGTSDTDTTATETNPGGETPSSDATPAGAPDAETTTTMSSGDSTTDGGTTLSSAECRQKTDDLQSELSSVQSELDAARADVSKLERRHENFEEIVQLWESPSDSDVRAAQQVGERAREAVVFLELGGGSATGWYVDDHHVITNAHNVYRGGQVVDSASVWTLGGDEYTGVDIVGYVESTMPDIAVLRTERPAPHTLSTGSSESLSEGQTLVQVGNPGGVGNWIPSAGKLVRTGLTSSLSGEEYSTLTTTVPGVPGVSGSPLLDLDGNVVAVTNAGQPIKSTEKGETPLPAEPVVYDRLVASLSYGNHVTIEVAMEKYNEWTDS